MAARQPWLARAEQGAAFGGLMQPMEQVPVIGGQPTNRRTKRLYQGAGTLRVAVDDGVCGAQG